MFFLSNFFLHFLFLTVSLNAMEKTLDTSQHVSIYEGYITLTNNDSLPILCLLNTTVPDYFINKIVHPTYAQPFLLSPGQKIKLPSPESGGVYGTSVDSQGKETSTPIWGPKTIIWAIPISEYNSSTAKGIIDFTKIALKFLDKPAELSINTQSNPVISEILK